MIESGKQFEEIVELLTRFREEVRAKALLGLYNINKHSENFVKRILNFTYGYELENLNKNSPNYAGLDLGDTGEGVAYQLSSTKKSDKIDNTLQACLKYERYKTYPTIMVFILTSKQSSYSIKTITQPHFTFLPEKNIQDFDDLFKEIQNLNPIAIRSLHQYISSELGLVIDSIRGKEPDVSRFHLDTDAAMKTSRMPKYFAFQAKIQIQSEKISVPSIHSGLSAFLQNTSYRNQFFPVFNELYRKPSSPEGVVYLQNLQSTQYGNYFHGYALVLERSSITMEAADYANEQFLTSLDRELVPLLLCIFYFYKAAKSTSAFDLSIHMASNSDVYLTSYQSMVIAGSLSAYKLYSPYQVSETLRDVEISTLVDLIQNIVHGFMAEEGDRFTPSPFAEIDRKKTEWHINNLRREFGIDDVSVY